MNNTILSIGGDCIQIIMVNLIQMKAWESYGALKIACKQIHRIASALEYTDGLWVEQITTTDWVEELRKDKFDKHMLRLKYYNILINGGTSPVGRCSVSRRKTSLVIPRRRSSFSDQMTEKQSYEQLNAMIDDVKTIINHRRDVQRRRNQVTWINGRCTDPYYTPVFRLFLAIQFFKYRERLRFNLGVSEEMVKYRLEERKHDDDLGRRAL